MRKLLSVLFSTLQGEVRGGLLFVALLATTILWARPFQVGDLYYKVPEDNGIESLPFVPSPGAGRTTVVLYVPENTPAGCYAVGTVNGWEVGNTDFMFTPIEGTGEGWVASTFDYAEDMQIKVCAIPSDPAVALGWQFQWAKNVDPWNELVEDNVVILEGAGYLELENQGQPKLVGLEDDGVVYIEIKDWASNPYIEPIPCETAAFEHPWGSGDWVFREATKTADATFELNAIYGGTGLFIATDVYGNNVNWYPEDQIEFIGDVAQGDSVNFKFISEKSTFVGRMIVTLIEKGTGVDTPWYTPSKKSPTVPQKRASIDSRRKVVVTYQSESSDNYAYLSTVYIPETVVYNGKTYEVVGIDDGAFANSPITSITIPNSVKSIGDAAFQLCSSLTSVTIGESVTSIGDWAFYNCEKLGTLVLGDKVKEIGEEAFNGCNKLYHIYCYAPEPPMAYESSFANYNVNLYVPCNYLDNYKYDRVFGSFRYIQCIESEDVTTNGVVITPSTNDVTIIWPTEIGADTYTIVIKKGNEVFCTLTFNAEGQLRNISFAPGRDGNHPVQYAEQASNGYRFTVTGLEEGTHYTYNIDVKNAANKTIKSYTGEFTTESMTAVENITTNNANIQKILRDGQLLILRDGVEYTIMGAEIQ